MSTPTRIECHVDPVCPFAWVTSRWLANATADRPEISVELRLMSLAVLNEGTEPDEGHRARVTASRRAGRLFAAATADDAPIDDLYLALGRRIHLDPQTSAAPLSTETAAAALAECGLDPALAAALDDASYDDEVRARHARGQQALGASGGSPITVVDGRAFFGPVLTEIPDAADGARLLTALTVVAATPAFAQFERPRSGPPTLTERGAA